MHRVLALLRELRQRSEIVRFRRRPVRDATRRVVGGERSELVPFRRAQLVGARPGVLQHTLVAVHRVRESVPRRQARLVVLRVHPRARRERIELRGPLVLRNEGPVVPHGGEAPVLRF